MRSPRPLRAAVIGCGKIGSTLADDPLLTGDVFTHAEAYVRCEHTQLVAVCDRDSAAANAAARKWKVKAAFDDVKQMLRDARPDLVSVCTPSESHAVITRTVVEHGATVSGILCEKPLATEAADAVQLVVAARSSGKTLAVAYMRRYAENMRQLRDLLETGELGSTRAISGWYTKGVLHNGSHWFDLLRMLAGEVAWVEAVERFAKVPEDPALDVTLGLVGGSIATLRAFDDRDFSIFEMDILLQRGRVNITDSGHSVVVSRAGPSPRYSGFVELVPYDRGFGHRRDLMLHAVEDLSSAVSSGRAPLCTAEDGIAALRIAQAAITSARENIRVPVES